MWHSLRWHSLQCSTTCNGRICNVGPPRGYLARPEGAEDAGAPGQLSLAVETGSLAFIASVQLIAYVNHLFLYAAGAELGPP